MNKIITRFKDFTINESYMDSKGIEYSDIEQWAYEQIRDSHEGFNDEEDAIEYMEWFFEMFTELPQKVKLYRILQVDSPDDINKDNLGRHFTDDPENFTYEFLLSLGIEKSDVRDSTFHVVCIEIDKEFINLEYTISARITHPYEDEYYIDVNAPFDIVSVDLFDSENIRQ